MAVMIEPFLKWPGGKRWLVHKYPHLLPMRVRRYIEPFLGGGAVFFSLLPKNAMLSDSNAELINAYNCIKGHPGKLERALRVFQKRHCIAFYYKMRLSDPKDRLSRAARFLYLNRTCFNGIYRVNLSGQFNVPIGTKTQVAYPTQYLSRVAIALRAAQIIARDFEATISLARSGDFLYVDPPYTVMHNSNNFVKYNDVLFSWRDQERLADAVHQAAKRGVMVFVSNADHVSVRKLYKGIWRHHTVSRSSILAAASDARRLTTEIAITNYT
jgi:DNA adenine methylase